MSDLSAIDTLKHQILEHRCSGEVHVEILEKYSSKAVILGTNQFLDQFVVHLRQGLKPLGSSWRPIDRQEAQEIILLILAQDLAYNSEIMSVELARSLSEQFLALFDDSCQYFTNGNFRSYYLNRVDEQAHPLKKNTPHVFGGWMPLTEATFDTGVICFDETYTALIWVEDED
jgi:hypothetical protein